MVFIEEQFPFTVNYESNNTLQSNQADVNSCTKFGSINAIDCMSFRAGVNEHYSKRFQWYFRFTQSTLSVESAITQINQVGLALEQDDPYLVNPNPPYNLLNADAIPSHAAFMSANARKWTFEIKRISSKTEVKRALCQGSTLIIVRVFPGGAEHCEAVIGYDEVKGMRIHGSAGFCFWESWSSLGLIITQVYRFVKSPFPFIPHPDYVAGTQSSLTDNILVLPTARIYVGWPTPSLYYKNIVFDLQDQGQVSYGTDMVDEIIWYSPTFTLQIPRITVNGVLKYNMKLKNPVALLLQAEEQTAPV
jgi:hypothetical protein